MSSIYNKYGLPLFDEVSKNNKTDYDSYRCFTNTKNTGPPWFPTENTCPCNINENNITGRGYTSCNFGISEKQTMPSYFAIKSNKTGDEKSGSLFNQKQNVPPQLDPYPAIRIGQEWRTVQ